MDFGRGKYFFWSEGRLGFKVKKGKFFIWFMGRKVFLLFLVYRELVFKGSLD